MEDQMMHDSNYDRLYEEFVSGNQVQGIEKLVIRLHESRSDGEPFQQAIEALRNHKLFELVRKDPYTNHSMQRPRGYPGDAELIDMIYRAAPAEDPGAFGQSLFDRTIACGASEAVRQRLGFARQLLAGSIANGQSICSLAGGHLREAEGLAGQNLGRFTVVDQDAQSLAEVRDAHGSVIETIEANVFNWLRTAPRDGRAYDLVYSLGLTDYLDARQLLIFTKLAAGIMAPGGRMILANFHDHRWSAYMEAAMDWYLIYRTEEDMANNAADAGLQHRIFRDATGYIIYCEMWK
jgi:extracellular factor (EF) 3-hydroxypalmitic acid methyl ester biosynthesis protein